MAAAESNCTRRCNTRLDGIGLERIVFIVLKGQFGLQTVVATTKSQLISINKNNEQKYK